jgi:hypothetical protein
MSQSEGPRIVSKFVEGLSISYTHSGTAWTINNVTGHTNWVNVGSGVFNWQGYIDLSGYRPDDMVLSPAAVQLQYGGAWLGQGDTQNDQGAPIVMQYAITTDKIDDIAYGAAGIAEPLAGFIGDNSEMDQVVLGGTEVWAPGSNRFFAYGKVQESQYGDGVPIVGPRLYIAIRIALTPPRNAANDTTTDGVFFIPGMRFVIAGNVSSVPEFQLLHLMKRQIDLQQTPDVDV